MELGAAGRAWLTITRGPEDPPLPERRMSEVVPLSVTPEDEIFAAAAQVVCPACGAVCRVGVRRPETVPRPTVGNRIAAVACFSVALAVVVGMLYLVPRVVIIGFALESARSGAERIFDVAFALAVAGGALGLVVVLARWTVNQVRRDPTHIEPVSGPAEPGHHHVGHVHTG